MCDVVPARSDREISSCTEEGRSYVVGCDSEDGMEQRATLARSVENRVER